MARAGVGDPEAAHVASDPHPASAWASALIVFSGPGHEADLAARLRARGIHVRTIDTKVGGYRHDVTRQAVAEELISSVAAGLYDFVFIATPCSSYSVAHRPRLRSRRSPLGVASVPVEWQRYLHKHNLIGTFTARLIAAATSAGVAWAVENPADRGDSDSLAYWPRFADHAPLWHHPDVDDAIASAGGAFRTFSQCSFGSPFQKWTTIAHAPAASPELAGLDSHGCPHGRAQHEAQAHGLSPDGSSLSGMAAAYPPAMNEFLASAISRALLRTADAALGAPTPSSGGRVSDGRELGSEVAALCEAARHHPPRWASLRNRRAATPEELRADAIPGDLYHPHIPSKPPIARAARLRAQRAREAAAHAGGGTPAARQQRIDQGPIHISELYLEGVYGDVIVPWMRRADAAGAAIRAGARAARVPTVTIRQDRMQPWARGVVWDCADPDDCRPVERSTRSTAIPPRPDGTPSRHLDAMAFRRVAAELEWHDLDIVQQVGDGGVEPRSHCPLDTVLAFHHPSLVAEFDAAAKVVDADLAEGWVAAPTRHLPFVPCRLLPRGMVLQERARMTPASGGAPPAVETYLKPRITMDSSNGGDDAVNAGVESHERGTSLPRSQDHARGLAICDTAGGDSTRAASYVVDAESAYRFCPVQRADQWTQCFLWWGGDGAAGVCVDRRLGFGGAFAPNRFQRISTMVAAHVQRLQAAFDATQPLPPPAVRWAEERRSRQRLGLLPDGEAQLSPRYLQVYVGARRQRTQRLAIASPSPRHRHRIAFPPQPFPPSSPPTPPGRADDFSGAALLDAVVPPESVRGIDIDPIHSSIDGGVPAEPRTRVYVHAQLAVRGLRDVGLSAAPAKVVVGDPVISLGLRVSRAARQINCPDLKRASILSSVDQQRSRAVVGLEVERAAAATLVGRAVNLSQVFPELNSVLHGGYAVTQASWRAGGRTRWLPRLPLRRHGGAYRDWLGFLDVLSELVDGNSGVSIAPAGSFPPRDAPGSLTVVTDASGKDGVGGYAFHPAHPHTAWMVSEWWPADIQRALDAAAARRDDGEPASPGLSMPAAELFGSIAVAAVVASVIGSPATAVHAVTDCDPAAAALNAATSGVPQIRHILASASACSPQWLAISVPREANVDADRLSHPSGYDDVERDAVAAGLAVRRVRIPPAHPLWATLRRAAELGVGRGGPPDGRA